MKKNLLFGVVLLFTISSVKAQSPARAGWWKFDDPADLLDATVGFSLDITGTADFVSGPDNGNNAIRINKGDFLIMDHGISPNGGGGDSLVNEYTIQIDFSMPVGGLWHALFQTNGNTDDAELFINTENFIGAWRFGYSTNVIEEGEWYRLVVSVKNGEFYKLFINGELWVNGAGQDVDSRDGLAEIILIFADNDGEDETLDCSELSIWDVALTDTEVAELGDASTIRAGVPELNTESNQKIQQLYPIHSNGISHFNYWLTNAGRVEFNLFDSSGRLIQHLNEGEKLTGKNQLQLKTDNLTNGVYLLQLRCNNQLVNQPVMIKN